MDMIPVGCVNGRSAGVCREASRAVERAGAGACGSVCWREWVKGVCKQLSFGGFAWVARALAFQILVRLQSLYHPNNSW